MKAAYSPTGAGERIYSDTRITAIYVSGSCPMGDADGSGSVTVSDALVVLRCAIGVINEQELVFYAADMNGDGRLSVSDAVTVLRLAMM